MVVEDHCTRECSRSTRYGGWYTSSSQEPEIIGTSPRCSSIEWRLMIRGEMEGGFIHYWKKQKMRGCTFCKSFIRLHVCMLISRTFLTVAQPTWLTRFLVLGAQGVMYNLFFLTYLISSKTAHRFVGALEEEACRT